MTRDILYSCYLDTPLGSMIAVSNDNSLLLLEFADNSNLLNKVEKIKQKTGIEIIEGQDSNILKTIQDELKAYFDGKLKQFNTPIIVFGTYFQKIAWQELRNIPYGQTRSYKNQADFISNPKSYRAVANANSKNHIAIVVPCHRVINSDGGLGGYSGGVYRKKWLIEHEKSK